MLCTAINNKRTRKLTFCLPFILYLTLVNNAASGQVSDTLFSHQSLKKLSLEELMNIEVTSVSRHPEKLTEVASAVQVITHQDIRSAGVKTLPEALRLATNLQVAQVNSSQWAISARGFNNVLANKLLVLIDGRRVYTPLYAGVFWDVQNVVLEDIDRIEVISGPGGALWGANAVNGVINIITKNSGETQGLFAEGAIGTHLPGLGSLRYGGRISDKLFYRVYGTGFKLGSTLDTNKAEANDHWHMLQGGVRLDWEASARNSFSIQQNIYGGRPNPDATDTAVKARGHNIIATWKRTVSDRSSFQLRASFDHTIRDFGNGFTETLNSWDIDWQHRNEWGRHALTYGISVSLMVHEVSNLELFGFLPDRETLHRYGVFVQDEVRFFNDRLRVIVGTKVEHNNYTGIEYQPNVRLAWSGVKDQTFWAAVSRAVRTPARIDRDFFADLAPGIRLLSGNPHFRSERLIACELGWRAQPLENLSVSISTFYNKYDYVRSAEPGPPPFNIPITFGNGVKGNSYGVELSASSHLNRNWVLRGGYTFLKKDLEVRPDSKDLNEASAESNDPAHQLLVQSDMDLLQWLEWGVVARYTGELKDPYVEGYMELDMRIAWKLNRVIELNLVAQNLLNQNHYEFIPSAPAPRQIERGVYGKVVCRL